MFWCELLFFPTNRPHFSDRFKAVQPNDAQLSALFSTLSVFNIFLPLYSLICGLSLIRRLFQSLFVLSLFFTLSFSGDADENHACFIFSSEGAEYFSFAFSLSFYVLPLLLLFFQASLMCLWIRYHSVWMSSQTQMRGAFLAQCMHAFFIIQTRGNHMRSSNWTCLLGLSVCCSTHIRPYNC